MKLNTILIAAALAFVGTAASATTVAATGPTVSTFYDAAGNPVTDPEIGPGVYAIAENDGPGIVMSPFDYTYNFTLDNTSNLSVLGASFVGPTDSVDEATFSLYSGTSVTGVASTGSPLTGSFSFAGNTIESGSYAGLIAGNYYIELTGSTSSTTGTRLNVTFQAPGAVGPGGTPAIPEPTNMALMLAGLGLMGFMVKRRSQS